MNKNLIRKYLVISAITFIFVVFGVWELIDPNYWTGFVPSYVSSILSATILVRIHGTILTAIGLWLISGYQRKIAAIFASLVMLEIVGSLIVVPGSTDVLVRDIVILLAAISIYFDEK